MTDNLTVVSYINRQGGIRSLPLLKLSRSLLLWRSVHFLSLRATHVPGHLNLGPDLPSRGCPLVRDWRLHPFTVAQIWDLFGKTKLHLCASWYNTRLPCYAAWLGEERLSKSGSLWLQGVSAGRAKTMSLQVVFRVWIEVSSARTRGRDMYLVPILQITELIDMTVCLDLLC